MWRTSKSSNTSTSALWQSARGRNSSQWGRGRLHRESNVPIRMPQQLTHLGDESQRQDYINQNTGRLQQRVDDMRDTAPRLDMSLQSSPHAQEDWLQWLDAHADHFRHMLLTAGASRRSVHRIIHPSEEVAHPATHRQASVVQSLPPAVVCKNRFRRGYSFAGEACALRACLSPQWVRRCRVVFWSNVVT